MKKRIQQEIDQLAKYLARYSELIKKDKEAFYQKLALKKDKRKFSICWSQWYFLYCRRA